MMAVRILSLVMLLAVLSGCAATNLPPVTSPEYTVLEDEKRIWLRSEEEQADLADCDMLYHDKKLSSYLNDVAQKVLPAEAKKKITVHVNVINNPYSNAFAFANGEIYVHTGILARMDNEAQLASLLGHEMAHVTHRHQVRELHSMRNKSAGLASFRATLGSVPLVGELSSALGELGTMASVSGYSRALERESDAIGLQWMIDAGYAPSEAPKLFEHLMAEMEDEGAEEPFFFGSHPKLQDRHDNYTEFLESLPNPDKGIINRRTFEKNVAPAIYETALLDLKAGRYNKAEKGTTRYLKTYPRSSRAHFLLGEVYRQRAADGDDKLAIKAYRTTLKLNPNVSKAYMSMGIVEMKSGNKKAARKAFKNYLAKAGNSEEAGFVKSYLDQLQ